MNCEFLGWRELEVAAIKELGGREWFGLTLPVCFKRKETQTLCSFALQGLPEGCPHKANRVANVYNESPSSF